MRFFVVLLLMTVFSVKTLCAAESKAFKLTYNADWPPYSSGPAEQVDGILPALLRTIIESNLGMPVVSVGAPWKRAQHMVQEGTADGMVTVPTKERLLHSIRSKNIVYKLEMKPAVRNGSAAHYKLSANPTVETLRSLNVCDILGNGWAARFFHENAIKYQTVANVATCLNMVEKGRMDVVIQPAASIASEIKMAGHKDRLTVLPITFGQMDFTLLVSKKSSHGAKFVEQFDATLARMKENGTYDAEIEKLMENTGR